MALVVASLCQPVLVFALLLPFFCVGCDDDVWSGVVRLVLIGGTYVRTYVLEPYGR